MEILSRYNDIKMKMALIRPAFISIAQSSNLNQVQRTSNPRTIVNHKIQFPSWAIDTDSKNLQHLFYGTITKKQRVGAAEGKFVYSFPLVQIYKLKGKRTCPP